MATMHTIQQFGRYLSTHIVTWTRTTNHLQATRPPSTSTNWCRLFFTPYQLRQLFTTSSVNHNFIRQYHSNQLSRSQLTSLPTTTNSSQPILTQIGRSLHTATNLHQLLDEQTHAAAKAWNVAARLGTIEEIDQLEKFLTKFKREHIPAHSFDISHARSSGAGGQNVNKVNTKVDLRFKLDHSQWLPELARKCLNEVERHRINHHGEFVVTSERTRLQHENFEDCVDKLYTMIKTACALPKATDAAKIQKIKDLAVSQKRHRRADKERQHSKKESRRRVE